MFFSYFDCLRNYYMMCETKVVWFVIDGVVVLS